LIQGEAAQQYDRQGISPETIGEQSPDQNRFHNTMTEEINNTHQLILNRDGGGNGLNN
jgi:hypothetical protein